MGKSLMYFGIVSPTPIAITNGIILDLLKRRLQPMMATQLWLNMVQHHISSIAEAMGKSLMYFGISRLNNFGFYQWNSGGLTPAAPAVDDPVIKKYSPGLHIFYRGYYGIIFEVFLNEQFKTFGFNQWNSGGLTPAPPAAEKNSNLSTMEYGPQLHIFYRGDNGQICDVF